MWNSKPVVAIFGSSQTIEGDEQYEQARQLGRLLARSGIVVCNGGYGGVMEASCRGASEMKGVSIGLTLAVFDDKEANPFVTREIKNATLFERLANFLGLADAFVVLKGGIGTLAELFTVWNMMQTRTLGARPFVFVGRGWPKLFANLRMDMEIRDKDLELFRIVSTPDEALEIIRNHLHIDQ